MEGEEADLQEVSREGSCCCCCYCAQITHRAVFRERERHGRALATVQTHAQVKIGKRVFVGNLAWRTSWQDLKVRSRRSLVMGCMQQHTYEAGCVYTGWKRSAYQLAQSPMPTLPVPQKLKTHTHNAGQVQGVRQRGVRQCHARRRW